MSVTARWSSARAATVVVVGLVLALVAGCDPCAGVVACHASGSEISYSGRIMEAHTGRGVGGVLVEFRRTGGGHLERDTLQVRTDGEGRYVLAGSLQGDATPVVGDVEIHPPAPAAPYVVSGVSLAASPVRGAGGVLPTWLANPYISFVGVLGGRRGLPVGDNAIRFVRRSGARLASDTIASRADGSGYFYLQVPALEGGDVIGDITVSGGALKRPYTLTDVRATVVIDDRLPEVNRVWRIGSVVNYSFLVRRRGTDASPVGAVVEFRRVGGVPTLQNVVTDTLDADGYANVTFDPTGEPVGDVIADVTVRGGGLPAPYVIRGVHLPTRDSDELQFGGVLSAGYAAIAVGEVVYRGDQSGIGGVDVRFVRTGGPTTTPNETTARTQPDGRFGLSLSTDSAGDVVGTLTVPARAGGAPVVFRDVVLHAGADDSVRFFGRFAVGGQLAYNGILVQRATGTPAANWTVVFRRTSGIALATDTLASRVLDWGGFGLALPTREAGAVTGTLTAVSPDRARTVPLGEVELATHEDDVVRLAGQWAVGPSLLYVGELRRAADDALVVGARVEFRRTGGIATVEPSVGETTNREGRFRLALTPLASGEVVGDLHIVPPAPLRDTTIVGVRLATFESDEVRLGGVWRIVP